MHPANAPVLKAAGIDVASLANNHTLDWQEEGLLETLRAVEDAGTRPVGAGRDLESALKPAIVQVAGAANARVVVFAFATPDSGVPAVWAAREEKPGLAVLPRLDEGAVKLVSDLIERYARDGDIVVFSVHWGGNWGYDIPRQQVEFAHRLIDEAGVDIVHGHSSHHPRGLEVYKGRLIVYGAGDLINDYEGIGGHEQYRPDLSLMYLPKVDAGGELKSLRVVPMRIEQMRLRRAGREDAEWLRERLNRESGQFGVRFELKDGELVADWRRIEAQP